MGRTRACFTRPRSAMRKAALRVAPADGTALKASRRFIEHDQSGNVAASY